MSKAKPISDGLVPTLTASSMPDRSTNDNLVLRRDIKRSFNIPVSVEDFALSGTTDFTPAVSAALLEVGQSTDKRLYVPGFYNITGPLVMDYPITMYGDSMSRSGLISDDSGVILTITGKYGTGPSVHDLSFVFDTGGGTSAAHILVSSYQNPGTPTDQYSPDFCSLKNLNLTGFNLSTAGYNLRMTGAARSNSDGGTIPIGLRNVLLDNIQMFNATFRGLELECVRAAHGTNLNLFGGAGVGNSAVIGSSGSFLADTVTLVGCVLNGTLSYSNTNNFKMYGCTPGGLSSAGTNTGFVNL